ncbi:MAG: SxtJ family membrane protein [Isosphaeraceae bacterium]
MQWSDIPKKPTDKMLRQFGLLCLVFFGGIAIYGLYSESNNQGSVAFALIAFLSGLAAILKPSLLKYIFIGWMILAFPIGFVVSKILLLSIFLLVFMPVSLIFRLIGRDALALRRKSAQTDTYWLPKQQPADPSRYLRQY